MSAPIERLLGQPALNERESFRNLVDALRVAETACRQLALMREQPHWLLAQSGLEAIRETVTKLMTAQQSKLIHPWVSH